MQGESKIDYYRRRSSMEEAAAVGAAGERSRAIHVELAALHRQRADALAATTPPA